MNLYKIMDKISFAITYTQIFGMSWILQYPSRIWNYLSDTFKSSKPDITVGIMGLGPESFGYYYKLEETEQPNFGYVTSQVNGRNIKVQMIGEATHSGRGFHYHGINYDTFDYVVLHYGKNVYSMTSKSIIKYLLETYWMSCSKINLVFILTTTNDAEKDMKKLTEKYGKHFKSIQFIPNFYTGETEGKRFDHPGIQKMFLKNSQNLLQMLNI